MPLYQHVMVGKRMLRPVRRRRRRRAAGFVKEGAPVNPELLRIARDDWRQQPDARPPRAAAAAAQPGAGAAAASRQRPPRCGSRAASTSSTGSTARACCRRSCSSSAGSAATRRSPSASTPNLRLTTPEERDEIRAFVEDALPAPARRGPARPRLPRLPRRADPRRRRAPRRDAAGVQGVRRGAVRPRACARSCSPPRRSRSASTCRPASVVIEKLSKWNGETHADITPGEYTQLTGRAGRRGIDVEGHGVVLWQPGIEPAARSPASPRPAPTRSGRRSGRRTTWRSTWCTSSAGERARELLESSFAQFQADKAVVGLARQLRKSRGRAARATPRRRPATSATSWSTPRCAAGSPTPRRRGRAARSGRPPRGGRSRRWRRCEPGDVIEVPAGKFAGFAVVIDPGLRRTATGPRPYVLTADRQARRLAMVDFPTPVERVDPDADPARLQRPQPAVAARPRLGAARPDPRPHAAAAGAGAAAAGPRRRRRPRAARSAGCGPQLRAHPCHGCPDREDHARWAERWYKLDRDADDPAAPRSSSAPTPSPGSSTGSARC